MKGDEVGNGALRRWEMLTQLQPEGKVHDVRQIPSLSVTVGSQVVHLPYEFGALPQYEREILHYDITEAR
jgi:hypothetical protein